MAELFDKVKLIDGTVGTIAEVLEPGIAYMFEFIPADGAHALDVKTVYQDEIESVFSYEGLACRSAMAKDGFHLE